MRKLIKDFFTAFDARVREEAPFIDIDLRSPDERGDRRKLDERALARLDELRGALHTDQLRLAFEQEHAGEGAELVVEGGHILRVIESFMARFGARLYVERPAKHRLSRARVGQDLELAAGIAVKGLSRDPVEAWDAYYIFRVRYHSRERRDSVECVRVPYRPSGFLEAELKDAPRRIASWPWKPRKQPPAALQQASYQRACRGVERAALEKAQAFRREQRQRLDKDLRRLRGFYESRILELKGNKTPTDKARDRIIALEEEQHRKTEEMLRAIDVEVDLELIQVLVIALPFQRAELELERPGATPEAAPRLGRVAMIYDRARDRLALDPCGACEGSLSPAALCGSGHVLCRSCLLPCACGRDACAACQPKLRCQACQRAACELCLADCADCGEASCPEHRRGCGACAREACVSCLAPCHVCDKDLCRRCPVGRRADEQARLCADCGAACADCGAAHPLVDLARCPMCGRRFCLACRDVKGACGACRDMSGAEAGP